MALFDIDKTTITLPLALKLISASLIVAGGVWRFESKMGDLQQGQVDLKKEIIYKYTIEIMKINNRIDLIEAKKFVERRNFKRDTLSVNTYRMVQNTRTNNGKEKQEKYPQVCMLVVTRPECQRKKFNIKKLAA